MQVQQGYMGSATMADQANHWTIQCRDPFGRKRAVQVFLSATGHVALQVPPGESAILGPVAVGELHDALDRAAVAAHQLGGRP